MVHELSGTTFSNPAERGDYDSQATVCGGARMCVAAAATPRPPRSGSCVPVRTGHLGGRLIAAP
ncbi:hypothetical protein [Actinomadura sp. 6N118]|uniref:hypothetical protein n=1 Tax=Actinomadura sp. 6N118 TaxID=3375151 RepID=UPI0037B43E94